MLYGSGDLLRITTLYVITTIYQSSAYKVCTRPNWNTMDSLVILLQTEWTALTSAPWSFVLLVISSIGATFGVCRWVYQSQFEAHKEKQEVLKERLSAKDDLLDDYRERLGLVPSTGSKFSKLTHKELQEYTLNFVNDIRSWMARNEEENRHITSQQWHAMTQAKTEEQKHQLWETHNNTLSNGILTLMRDFEQQYKIDAILMRDELIARLPASERNPSSEKRYEMPVNTFCIRTIADDLERKAKVLR